MLPDTYAHKETHTLLKHFHAQPHILSKHIAVEVEAVHSATAEHFSGLLSCHCAARTHTHTHAGAHTSPYSSVPASRRGFTCPAPSFTFHSFHWWKETGTKMMWNNVDIIIADHYSYVSFACTVIQLCLSQCNYCWEIIKMNKCAEFSERKRIFSSMVISLH